MRTRGGPGTVFRLELAAALAGPRAVAVRLGVTLLLGAPFLVVSMPARGRTAGLTLLVAFTALFGAVVGRSRRREDGREERLRLLPLAPWSVAADTCLAGAVVDLAQVAPLVAASAVLTPGPRGPGGWLALGAALVLAVAALNGLGYGVARLVRSNAEAHLYGALAVGLVALTAGVVPTPARLAPWLAAVAPWNPLHPLAAALGPGPAGLPAPAAAAVVIVFAVLCAARLGVAVSPRAGRLPTGG